MGKSTISYYFYGKSLLMGKLTISTGPKFANCKRLPEGTLRYSNSATPKKRRGERRARHVELHEAAAANEDDQGGAVEHVEGGHIPPAVG